LGSAATDETAAAASSEMMLKVRILNAFLASIGGFLLWTAESVLDRVIEDVDAGKLLESVTAWHGGDARVLGLK
jgi:hypothetical protein